MRGWLENLQKIDIPAAKQVICQVASQRPARVGPILPMSQGATHVASISNVTDKVLAAAIWVES